jgi:O-antigen/teichoic acid export membrane protein
MAVNQAGSRDAGGTDPRSGRAPTTPDRMRAIAAVVCAVQALVLLGFCVFYLWELAQGGSADAGRAVMSVVLIAVFAIGLGLLGRAWQRGANWPNTPTVVWNLLLMPVSLSLVQSGHAAVGGVLAAVALGGIVAAVRARTSEPHAPSPPPPQ